jgi:hypothetical protein
MVPSAFCSKIKTQNQIFESLFAFERTRNTRAQQYISAFFKSSAAMAPPSVLLDNNLYQSRCYKIASIRQGLTSATKPRWDRKDVMFMTVLDDRSYQFYTLEQLDNWIMNNFQSKTTLVFVYEVGDSGEPLSNFGMMSITLFFSGDKVTFCCSVA